jgi:hypothetical protein
MVLAVGLLYRTFMPDNDGQSDAEVGSRRLAESVPQISRNDRPEPNIDDSSSVRTDAKAKRDVPTLEADRPGSSTSNDQAVALADSASRLNEQRALNGGDVRDEPKPIFSPSDAIRETCAKYAKDSEANCSGQQTVLDKLSREQRDRSWAIAMESEIRAAVAAVAGYQTRAVECRTTVCVLEVESGLGGFRASNLRSIKSELELVDLINGYERKSAGQLTTVTLMTFQRKGS